MHDMPMDLTNNTYAALQLADELENLEVHPFTKTNKNDNGDKEEESIKYPLVWIDLEMTGLDVETDQILQIACIITDGNLETQVVGEEITIHHPDDVLLNMNPWCIDHHGKSGLAQAVRDSAVSLEEAEARTLAFMKQHIPTPGAAQIAGNSVHTDVAFMRKYMPSIIDYCHYRLVDVSSVGELCRRWFPRDYGRQPRKKSNHTALSDIKESIEQLKYYKKTIFVAPASHKRPNHTQKHKG